MKCWLVVTSYENFKYDRDFLGFKFQGLPYRFRKQVQRMQIGDKVVYYIMKLQKFGAIATIVGDYFEDDKKLWVNDDEMWPSRRESKADIVLLDDELIDVKRLVNDLSFIKRKEVWGVFFQGSIRNIPEDDFKSFKNNKLYRLMDCLNFVKKGSKLVFDSTDYIKFKEKGEKIIHWLPKENGLVNVEIVMPDNSIAKGFGEAGIKDIKEGQLVQLERFGFARCDKKEKDRITFWFTHK